MKKSSIIEQLGSYINKLQIRFRPITIFFASKFKPAVWLYIALSLLVLVFASIFYLFSKIENRLIISVDGYRLDKIENISIGSNSDICYRNIPQDVMMVSYDNDKECFSWNINKDILKDSLLYYQINGKNPNIHKLSNNDQINIEINSKNISLDLSEIRDLLENCDNQYILLRRILEKKDTTFLLSPEQQKCFNSFIWNPQKDSNEELSICILDNFTTLQNDTSKVGYVYNGITDQFENSKKKSFKVQFYSISENIFTVGEETDFHNGRIHYSAKPVVCLTEWGAGHFMLVPNKTKGIDVRFPKGIIYVENLDTLREQAKITGGIVTYSQNASSFPSNNLLYVPQFSKGLNQSICRIQFNTDKEICVMDDANNLHQLNNNFSLDQLYGPNLEKFVLSSSNGDINCRIGFLNSWFKLSYVYFPFLILLLITISSRIIYKFKSFHFGENKPYYLKEKSTNFVNYFNIIAFTTFAYCLCKILIALKLSYTYPCFEKISGIIVYSVSLMITFFFILSLVLNIDYVNQGRNKLRKKILAIFTPIIMIALCMFGMSKIDKGMNEGVLASYYPDDLFIINALKWQSLPGMNDTHRTVIYTLLSLCIFTTLYLLLQLLFPDKIKAFYNYIHNKTQKISKLLSQRICQKIETITSNEDARYSIKFIFSCIPYWLFLFSLTFLPGNFATAFITLSAIITVTYLIQKVNVDKINKLTSSCLFISIVVISFGAVIKADFGYITNFLGYLSIAVVAMFIIKSNTNLSTAKQLRKNTNLIIASVILIILAVSYNAPFIVSKIWGHTEEITYDRTNRRMMLYADYEDLKKSGYRYADSDTEFMVILSHYLNCENNSEGANDPLNANEHYLHPSISTGQSPVVLNDVSIQSSFFGAYGKFTYFIYWGLLLVLVIIVLTFNFNSEYAKGLYLQLSNQIIWRNMALLLWTSTTFYIFMSYIDFLPFTGRLNPGFGVDSVGESLETAVLLALMSSSELYKSKN